METVWPGECIEYHLFWAFFLGGLSWGIFGALWLWKISHTLPRKSYVEVSGSSTGSLGVLTAAAFSPVLSSTGDVSRASSAWSLPACCIHSQPSSPGSVCSPSALEASRAGWQRLTGWPAALWHSMTNSPHEFNEALGTSKTQRIRRPIFCLFCLVPMFLQHCRHLSASAQNSLFCWDFWTSKPCLICVCTSKYWMRL